MKKLKILMLGNSDSKWVKEYIEYVLLPMGAEVDVLGKKECKHLDFYSSNGVKIHKEKPADKIAARVPFVRIISSALNTYKGNEWGSYDIIINMFVNHRDLMITRKVKDKNTKTVCYYAGSDLLRKSRSMLALNKKILRKTDFVAVGSMMMYEDYVRKFPEDIPPTVANFGISNLTDIDRYMSVHSRTKEDKARVCIGYSGVREHRHLDVLSLFETLTTEEKKRIQLVLPMTYQATAGYIKEIREKLDSLGIEYNLLTEFMDNAKMAEMWCNVDYFINAQTTDSLSASVIESVYAGSKLINSSALDYPEYKELEIKPVRFGSFDELRDIIKKIANGQLDATNENNRQAIFGGMSWQAAAERWKNIFNGLIK